MHDELKRELAKFKATHILGIDESGTGACAGSFYLGAVLGPKDWNMKGVRDSKKTKAPQRLKLIELMDSDVSIFHAEAPATVPEIAKYGHASAYRRAFMLSVNKAVAYTDVYKKNIVAIVDGSPNHALANILKASGFLNILFMVKADAKVPHVSAASIFAKKFPEYYFSQHAGYATLLHRQKIAEHGLIPNVHRP